MSPRALLLGVAATGALVASMLIVFMLMGSQSAPNAQAIVNTTTPTPGPAPTPKPNGLGNLSGLFDVDVGPGLFNCIFRTDEDSVTLEVKTAAQCYTQVAVGFGGAEPPCDAQHTTGGPLVQVVPGEGTCAPNAGNPAQPQMPPPPPYTSQQPTKLVGKYCVAAGCIIPGTGGPPLPADTLYNVGCFADIGSAIGPNVVWVTTTNNAKLDLPPIGSAYPPGDANAFLTLGATNAQCTAAQAGTAPAPLGFPTPLTLTQRATTRDFDGDGCTDMAELFQDKISATTKCGDDPFNPYDPTSGFPLDVSGSYDVLMEAIRADVPVADSAGLYFDCKADIQQSGKSLTARILCYIDARGITVNSQVAAGSFTMGVASCPPAAPKFCGDGLPGSSPPGCNGVSTGTTPCAVLPPAAVGCGQTGGPCNTSQYIFSDVDSKHPVLTGVLDNVSNTMNLSGCFEDLDGFGQLGNVYWQVKINAHTGAGNAITYIVQPAACAGSPVGGGVPMLVAAVRQAPGNKAGASRDSDGDGCPDKKELGDTAGAGGLRDPMNRWDYFDPTRDHKTRADDLLKVALQFGKNLGNPAYTIDTDRTGIIGANVWNLGPPDGQQFVADGLAVQKQYGHDCG